MCGIAGLYGVERTANPESIVRRMCEQVAHRGPDAQGVQRTGNCVLGHRRLSIIDLGEQANQPMSDLKGRYTLVFNGEIYNYQALKSSLKNYQFKTNSDTEVLLAAYAEWGAQMLSKLNGMFALAIWDKEEESLLLARDRMGIKPLYLASVREQLVFCSEIRGLLASGLISARLNREKLDEYLAYQTVHGTDTMLEGVSMLPAGSFMKIQDNESQLNFYWKAQDYEPLASGIGIQQVHEGIRQRLFRAVERRLVSDVPFGAFLSGGIDSSLMVACMSELGSHPVKTFNISFEEKEYSEARYAQIIADRYKTDHHEIRLQPQALLDILPEALAAMDHPSGDGPNSYLVSKVTKESGITMAISGLGGDELFAGYPHFMHSYKALSQPWIAQYPIILRRLMARLWTLAKSGVSAQKGAQILTALRMNIPHVYPIMRETLLRNERESLLGSKGAENPLARHLMDLEIDWQKHAKLSQVSLAEFNTYLRDVLLRDTDQMSMAHALEVRVPFLDHELVEYVLSIPDEFKFPKSPKSLLVDSMAEFIPREVVDRPKMGFTFPWEHWMKNELRSFCQEKISSLDGRGLFQSGGVQALWARFIKGDVSLSWARIWPLIVLESWIQENHVQT